MSSILFEIKDGVAIITLNRPEKYNSFNQVMAFHSMKNWTNVPVMKRLELSILLELKSILCRTRFTRNCDPEGPE